MKGVVVAMRDVVLGVDPRIDECIKWQAPTFTFEGNIASFFPRSKKHASLMFHQGAKIPGRHPCLEDTGETARAMKIGSIEELEAARGDLEKVIRAWIAWKQNGGQTQKKAAKPTPKKSTRKKAPAKKPGPSKKEGVRKKAARKKVR